MKKNLLYLIAVILLSSVVFGQIDPLTEYVESTYTYSDFFENPYPSYGSITGADGFNHGQDFTLLWANGNLGFFHEGDKTPYKIIITPGTAGVSEVPADIFGGDVAVADANTIYFYDQSGKLKNNISVTGSDILDISYHAEREKIYLVTTSNLAELNLDGSLTQIHSIPSYAIEVHDMESNPETYNMIEIENLLRL